MPATYVLPDEQASVIGGGGSSHLAGGDGQVPEMMERELMTGRSPLGGYGRSSKAPAKYDSLGYSTVGLGLGLYDDSDNDAREAYHGGGIAEGAYDGYEHQQRYRQYPYQIPGRSQVRPTYDPSAYNVLPRTESEPSFTSVPKYSPPRILSPNANEQDEMQKEHVEYSSGSPAVQQEPVYLQKIVEEPEEAMLAPLSPQLRARENGKMQAERREQSSLDAPVVVPIPATPSLVNAIKRVSEAQAQARAWRVKQQHASLSISSPSNLSPSPSSSSSCLPPSIPEREKQALQQAALRRQASAEWWNEVERKASESMSKERRDFSATGTSNGKLTPNRSR
jgi:hypothetical protein